MSQVENPSSNVTLVDLTQRFGAMPAWRIRTIPVPGTATESDVAEIEAREKRLCELVDGVLVEKVMGSLESCLAVELVRVLANFVKPRKFGIVSGEAGMMRLFPGLVRIPDAAFARREKFTQGRMPREPVPSLVPDLAAEILSEGNTSQEMSRKLTDYFEAGVRLVWYFDPRQRTVQVFTAPGTAQLLTEHDILTGGDVLPGFSLSLQEFFRDPLADLDDEITPC